MYFDKPAFSISITEENVKIYLDKIVQEKHWKDFKLDEITLVYYPFWIFNYHAYEEQKEDEKSKIIEVEAGKTGIDAVSGEINTVIPEVYSRSKIGPVKEPEIHNFEVVKAKIGETEINRLAPLKIASKIGVELKDVVVSGLEQVYLPYWSAKVEIEGATYIVNVNGVTGGLVSSSTLPIREKSWTEITHETINELQEPASWFKYLQSVLEKIFDFIIPIFGKIWEHQYGKIALIVLILILIIYFYL